MSIAPVVCTVEVKAAPARAFELFTAHMGQWWSKGNTPGKNPHVEIIVEPKPGGRWGERDAEGTETRWGTILAWEPPKRLMIGWQLSVHKRYDPDLMTEVEITFSPAEGGGTLVRLEHRNLERFGEGGELNAEKIRQGWPKKLAEFAAYADGLALSRAG